jgi:hypothetical protein
VKSLRDVVRSDGGEVRTALQFVKRALEVFYAHQDPEACLHEFFRNDLLQVAIASCEEFVKAANAEVSSDLTGHASMVESEVESLKVNLEESSGGPDLTKSRARALSAAIAVQELLIAATWANRSPVRLDEINDSVEAEALAKHGASYHALEAIDHSVKALGWSALDAASFATMTLGGRGRI